MPQSVRPLALARRASAHQGAREGGQPQVTTRP
jgi:hypothetical protein